MRRKESHDFLFKIVMIGDSGVGKSCVLLRFADDAYAETYISTIGVDFRFRTVKVGRKVVKLQIWDTAGQERFRTLTSAYYRGSDGVLLVYDVTNEDSFEHINDWMFEVSRYANPVTCRILVGNKCDRANKTVPTTRAQAFADLNEIPFIETSAKSNINVEEVFIQIATNLIAMKGSSSAQNSDLSIQADRERSKLTGSFRMKPNSHGGESQIIEDLTSEDGSIEYSAGNSKMKFGCC